MTEEVQMRVVAWVRNIANACDTCVKERNVYCEHCIARSARDIMKIVNEDNAMHARIVDCSYRARRNRVIEILRKANRPLLAKDIDLADMAYAQLKGFTLQQMLLEGHIGRKAMPNKHRKHGKIFYAYYLKETK